MLTSLGLIAIVAEDGRLTQEPCMRAIASEVSAKLASGSNARIEGRPTCRRFAFFDRHGACYRVFIYIFTELRIPLIDDGDSRHRGQSRERRRRVRKVSDQASTMSFQSRRFQC
jgi:hypothetical protein